MGKGNRLAFPVTYKSLNQHPLTVGVDTGGCSEGPWSTERLTLRVSCSQQYRVEQFWEIVAALSKLGRSITNTTVQISESCYWTNQQKVWKNAPQVLAKLFGRTGNTYYVPPFDWRGQCRTSQLPPQCKITKVQIDVEENGFWYIFSALQLQMVDLFNLMMVHF